VCYKLVMADLDSPLSPESLLSSVRARRGHFEFESGHHGDFWLDLETLCVRPAAIRALAADLAGRLRAYGVDAVCGPLNEGAFIALMVAAELDCDFTYAERFPHPTRDTLFAVEYRVPEAQHSLVRARRVAIVNDVISAGSAVRGAYANLQARSRPIRYRKRRRCRLLRRRHRHLSRRRSYSPRRCSSKTARSRASATPRCASPTVR
jgi:hypothetical protein